MQGDNRLCNIYVNMRLQQKSAAVPEGCQPVTTFINQLFVQISNFPANFSFSSLTIHVSFLLFFVLNWKFSSYLDWCLNKAEPSDAITLSFGKKWWAFSPGTFWQCKVNYTKWLICWLRLIDGSRQLRLQRRHRCVTALNVTTKTKWRQVEEESVETYCCDFYTR